jgi:hypothetical protein
MYQRGLGRSSRACVIRCLGIQTFLAKIKPRQIAYKLGPCLAVRALPFLGSWITFRCNFF